VAGLIEGKIIVGQLLNLKASSKIHGDIVTLKLSIEPGAVFSGNCKMSDTDTNAGNRNYQRKRARKSCKIRESMTSPGIQVWHFR